jgi:uncharacterized protein
MSGAFTVSVRDLSRRAGSVRDVHLTIPAPDDLGSEVLRIEPGSPLDLDLTLHAVSDGILVTGPVSGKLVGECARCLDPIEDSLTVELGELYYHPDVRDRLVADGDEDAKDAPVVEGDDLDIETEVRDAVVLDLPFTPLCEPNCPGLCPVCGIHLRDAEEGHSHDVIDPRWAKLEGLDLGDDASRGGE